NTRQPDGDRPGIRQAEVHAGRRIHHAGRGDRAAAVAPGPLWNPVAQAGGPPPEVCRTPVQQAGVHRRAHRFGEGDAQMKAASTKPYLIRAIHEWCADNGYTPYLSVKVDA